MTKLTDMTKMTEITKRQKNDKKMSKITGIDANCKMVKLSKILHPKNKKSGKVNLKTENWYFAQCVFQGGKGSNG